MGGSRRFLRAAALLAAVLSLPACGGSARVSERYLKGGADGTQGLVVTSEVLPPAQTGRSYGPVVLRSEGALREELTWSLWDGQLPAGLRLSPDGLLFGTPRERGSAVFTVEVTDGVRAAVATLALAVDDLALWACAGLTADEAWSDRPVELAVAGRDGPFRFGVDVSASGGRLVGVDDLRGRAVWIPGSAGGAYCEDLLRVTDLESGATRTLRISVRPDPTAVFVADFATTDVWYVNTSIKHGAHPFATDLHKALADIGLRGRESTGRMGRPADRLAELFVRRELLKALHRYYLRDGAPDRALPISFPFDEPGEGYVRPAPGTWARAMPNSYNEIAVLEGGRRSVVGTAFIDGASNPLLENDTSVGGSQLGAFVNVLVDYYNVLYASELRQIPIGDEDLPVLHALLHDLPSPGGRFGVIARQGRDFARVLATILAHEIGHSLGLPHTEPHAPNSLMNAQAAIEPWSEPVFSATDLALLRARLPGPGRGMPVGGASKPTLPEGGVSACDGKTCNLMLPHGPTLVQRLRAGSAPAPRSAQPVR